MTEQHEEVELPSDVQTLILSALVESSDSAHKLTPHLKTEYFETDEHKILFSLIHEFIGKYHNTPPKEAIEIELSGKSITEQQYQKSLSLLKTIYNSERLSTIRSRYDWVIDSAERFCVDRSVYLAIQKSISIIDGSDKKGLGKGAIPKILQDALNVSFDSHVGHDFIENSEERYDFYHKKEKRVSSGLNDLDHILVGGFPIKSLVVFVAPTGVGKSTALCSCAAAAYLKGENVLYITCEMAAEKIAERIDANLMDVPISNLMNLPFETYQKKIRQISDKTKGRLVIKEYPPATANVNHFRALLDELKLKKGFKPTIIFVDYLAICASSRMKMNDNLYAYGKTVAEELRGLAVEHLVPVVSAVQTNRAGQNNSDFELGEVSESHGVSMTADAMFALISTEQLEQINQIRLKQLKNRYHPIDQPKSLILGIDRSLMRLFDVNAAANPNSGQNVPRTQLPQSFTVTRSPVTEVPWKV